MSELRALVVEDRTYNRKDIVNRLEENSFTSRFMDNCDIVSSYDAAFKLLAQNNYDIAILDYLLDRKDCFHLLEEYRSTIKVVVIISAHTRSSEQRLDEGLKRMMPEPIFIDGPASGKAINKMVIQIKERLSTKHIIIHERIPKELRHALIVYIKSDGDNVHYYCQQITGSAIFKEENTLKELTQVMSIHGFVRCSKFCVVNSQYVIGFQKDDKGDGGNLIIDWGDKKEMIPYSNVYKEGLQKMKCLDASGCEPDFIG